MAVFGAELQQRINLCIAYTSSCGNQSSVKVLAQKVSQSSLPWEGEGNTPPEVSLQEVLRAVNELHTLFETQVKDMPKTEESDLELLVKAYTDILVHLCQGPSKFLRYTALKTLENAASLEKCREIILSSVLDSVSLPADGQPVDYLCYVSDLLVGLSQHHGLVQQTNFLCNFKQLWMSFFHERPIQNMAAGQPLTNEESCVVHNLLLILTEWTASLANEESLLSTSESVFQTFFQDVCQCLSYPWLPSDILLQALGCLIDVVNLILSWKERSDCLYRMTESLGTMLCNCDTFLFHPVWTRDISFVGVVNMMNSNQPIESAAEINKDKPKVHSPEADTPTDHLNRPMKPPQGSLSEALDCVDLANLPCLQKVTLLAIIISHVKLRMATRTSSSCDERNVQLEFTESLQPMISIFNFINTLPTPLKRSQFPCNRLSAMFVGDDETLAKAFSSILDIQLIMERNYNSDSQMKSFPLDSVLLFSCFAREISFDYQVIADLLISKDIGFLTYFIKFLKLKISKLEITSTNRVLSECNQLKSSCTPATEVADQPVRSAVSISSVSTVIEITDLKRKQEICVKSTSELEGSPGNDSDDVLVKKSRLSMNCMPHERTDLITEYTAFDTQNTDTVHSKDSFVLGDAPLVTQLGSNANIDECLRSAESTHCHQNKDEDVTKPNQSPCGSANCYKIGSRASEHDPEPCKDSNCPTSTEHNCEQILELNELSAHSEADVDSEQEIDPWFNTENTEQERMMFVNLKEMIQRSHSRKVWPYDPSPLIRLLNRVLE